MRYDAGKWKCWQKRNLDLLPGNLSPYFPPFSSLSHLSFSPTHSFPIFPSPSHPFPIFPSLPPFPSLPHIPPPLPFLQLFPSWRSPPQGLVRISNKGRHYTAANLWLQLETNFFQLTFIIFLNTIPAKKPFMLTSIMGRAKGNTIAHTHTVQNMNAATKLKIVNY